MLDQDTKRRIDNCRNILVGKISDPISQVKQITIALIYKFMDDMDQESIEMGGIASYFIEDYQKYSWGNVFNQRIGGDEMIQLYSNGIENMNQNRNLPQFLRDVFKDAYLPFRDPSTLKLFLKEINEFRYTHSEKLGDAFEYLISVLGSQGDAGQFRTPRHIIDFLVTLVNPQKGDKILDPSCGTSGFLISSYKHILKANTRKNIGDLLTAEERNKLISNISGYDISPDMVRLSLVNLYLHNFSNPKIFEYDTLTSEDKWSEYYDVILANPPFMTPKGGIKPHKRFSIQSNRAEVLFVDYIMEHLTPKGRSGIIVPEGIIFQSGTAYMSLRKLLVEKYLLGVISLPSGVFQPYSGVKTSILILDRQLSQKTDKIFFGKVDNDGFDLGAQRREIDKNDLPVISKDVSEYLQGLRNGKIIESEKLTYVLKEKIVISSDISLSYDRYSIKEIISSTYKIVELQDVCTIINGRAYKQEELLEKGKYSVLRVGNFFSNRGWYYSNLELDDEKYCVKGDLLFAWSASFGPKIWDGEKTIYHYHIWKIVPNETLINKKYLFFILEKNTEKIKQDGGRGIAMVHITKSGMEKTKIPLPPLEIQEEIVRELEQYQKMIDGAKQVVENYKPLIDIDPVWEMKELSEITEVITKGSTPTTYGYKYQENGINFIKIENLNEDGVIEKDKLSFIDEKCYNDFKRSQLKKDDILFSIAGTKMGIIGYVEEDILPSNTNQALCIIRLKKTKTSRFLFYYLKSNVIQEHIEKIKVGVAQSNISLKQIGELKIPILNEMEEKSIVERIENERKIIEGNKKLIEIYTLKIQDRINKIWGN
jgi:type I restriction enzyme M protein